jgi:hypothetical protein
MLPPIFHRDEMGHRILENGGADGGGKRAGGDTRQQRDVTNRQGPSPTSPLTELDRSGPGHHDEGRSAWADGTGTTHKNSTRGATDRLKGGRCTAGEGEPLLQTGCRGCRASRYESERDIRTQVRGDKPAAQWKHAPGSDVGQAWAQQTITRREAEERRSMARAMPSWHTGGHRGTQRGPTWGKG